MEQVRRRYIYYSDRKIDELRSQIPQSRWDRVTRRLSAVEVVVLGSGAKVSMQPSEKETILTSLQKVWVDLDDLKKIGTYDEPNEYVYEKLVFKYGIFDMFDPPLFVLAGATDRTIIVLGGQKQYVRGFRDRGIRLADDPLPVTMEPEVAAHLYASNGVSPESPAVSLMAPPDEEHSAGYAAMMYENWNWQGRTEYEVLAEVQLRAKASPPFVEPAKDVVIGSPVFVAMA